MKPLVEAMARGLVDDEEAIRVEEEETEEGLVIRLTAAPDDIGRLVGRRGRTVRAMRAVLQAAAARKKIAVEFEVVD